MNHKEYWKERFIQLQEAQMKKGEDYLKELEKQYQKAAVEIEKDIQRWYQRFAKNNGISFIQAKQWLSKKELEELRWTVEEYIQKGKENAVSGQWLKQLENASARVHISRLEALKLQMQQQCELICGQELDGVSKLMRRLYSDGYYHTAYEIQKGIQVGWEFASLDENKISKVLSKPWAADGKNFSERIWGRKKQLVNELHTQLTQMLIRGDAPDKSIDTIAKKFHTAKHNAGRLVMTESAYFSSASQKDCFEELGVEEYEVVATIDYKTSEICRSLDGKVFPVKDFQAGVTANPFHVECRSTTIPYFEDNEISRRAARDEETGKTYYIPGDMTYKQWKETFVDGGDKSGLTAVPHLDILESRSVLKNGVSDVHFVGRINKEIYRCITKDIVTDEVIITEKQIQHIMERHPGDYERFSNLFQIIVENPDYILEANKPNTAVILKKFENDGEVFKTILRIATSIDDPSYKNSIITFMKIDDKDWNRLLRNKRILYKRNEF